MGNEKRVYPVICASVNCGRVKCNGCPYQARLIIFKNWVKATNAVVKDEIWSPLVYTATVVAR